MTVPTPTPDTAAAQTVRADINKKRYFESMRHTFANSFSMLGELMQNARRAGATGVDFRFDREKRELSVTDDGHGIADFQTIVHLCESGWTDQVKLTDRPFGMGAFSLFFAAEKVSFRSRGLHLQVTLDDIVNGRSVTAVPDEHAPAAGTRITLHNLDLGLLAFGPPGRVYESFGEIGRFRLVAELVNFAEGFPIPVRINGAECARPYALDRLATTSTMVGEVHMPGIHSDGIIPESAANRMPRLFLQGLPIDSQQWRSRCVVHLDPLQFEARMPDRSHLFDDGSQPKDRICRATETLVQAFLADQKRLLEPKAFVERYWSTCEQHGCLHLTNDIPWVPRHLFASIEAVSRTTDDVGCLQDGALLHLDEFKSGAVTAWRHAPSDTGESAWAAATLKVMELNGIWSLRDQVPEGHWLNNVTLDADELTFSAMPVGARPESATLWVGGHDVTVQMVDSIEVSAKANASPAWEMQWEIRDNWIAVPAPNASATDCDTLGWMPQEMVCWMCVTDSSGMSPVRAFSTFRDDCDRFDDREFEQVQAEWVSVVQGLIQAPLATVVKAAMNSCAQRASPAHRQQLAAVRCTLVNRPGFAEPSRRFDVLDLEDDEFWGAVAEAYAARVPARSAAAALREAFVAAAKPGQLLGDSTIVVG